jgi:hypothetical protein
MKMKNTRGKFEVKKAKVKDGEEPGEFILGSFHCFYDMVL